MPESISDHVEISVYSFCHSIKFISNFLISVLRRSKIIYIISFSKSFRSFCQPDQWSGLILKKLKQLKSVPRKVLWSNTNNLTEEADIISLGTKNSIVSLLFLILISTAFLNCVVLNNNYYFQKLILVHVQRSIIGLNFLSSIFWDGFLLI